MEHGSIFLDTLLEAERQIAKTDPEEIVGTTVVVCRRTISSASE